MAQAKDASALAQGNVSQPHQWLEALAWTTVVSLGWIWRESGTTSKDKKQICLCPSRLPGIKRLSFEQLDSQGLTQQHCFCSHSSTPRLWGRVHASPAFWPGIRSKNEFPPQCTTMHREARARARACCDVNLMTSCCSDGRSKQLNKAIVVFLLHFVKTGGALHLKGCSLLFGAQKGAALLGTKQ